ncbi:unnamed protein product [Rhizophagus irregularis]|nr:unnamed protein product [Rhizophagus irregularis]CAB5354273.1 unnamed protein product [Rhizophagus irregularis]
MLFPNEDSYRKRIIRYREWYVNKIELLENVENLYNLYYELSKEEQITEEDIGNIRVLEIIFLVTMLTEIKFHIKTGSKNTSRGEICSRCTC